MIIGGGSVDGWRSWRSDNNQVPHSIIYTQHTHRERERAKAKHIALIIQNSAGVHNRFQTCKWLEFGMPFDSISMVNVTGQGI